MTNERTFRNGFRVDRDGFGHVEVSVFCGSNIGARGNCGQLTFRSEEWPQARASLIRAGWDEIPTPREAAEMIEVAS